MLEFIYLILVALVLCWASLVAQMVKTLPAMWETWVQSLGWEDPLEEGMATHSSVLACKIPICGVRKESYKHAESKFLQCMCESESDSVVSDSL